MALELSQRIIYEDNHLVVVNKLCGEISQGDKTGDICLPDQLKLLIKERDNKPGQVFLGVVHRLDRPTSGLMVFAKTSKALERLNELFRNRETKKTYWAIIEGQTSNTEGQLKHWLGRDEKRNKSFASDRPGPNLQEAALAWKALTYGDRYTLLEIDLFTGRHHQIRAQLGAIGFKIKGDLKYGAARSNPDGGICLHAVHLQLQHPVAQANGENKQLNFRADPRLVQSDKLWQHLMPPPTSMIAF